MGYLRDNPTFHEVVLVERRDAIWLVPADDGRWTVPGLVSGEQHTAEVEAIVRHVRTKYGVRVAVLGPVASDFDEAANRVRKAYLAEGFTDVVPAGRWWARSAVAAGDVALCEDVRSLVGSWSAGRLTPGEAAWNQSGWLTQALAWVSAHVGTVDDVAQVRVSEFSTVIRMLASGRALYFKAVGAASAREPAATAALARRTTHVPPVIAVDAARGFLLMEAFAGDPLASDDVAVWAGVARAVAELQQDCIDGVAELVSLGCEVVPATRLVDPIAALLADHGALLVGDPAGLTADEVAQLRALASSLVAEARRLDAGPLPVTVDHGDLWPSNVLVAPGGCAFVDWEDVRVAHPFLTPFQLITGAYLDRRLVDDVTTYVELREAYLAAWSRWAPTPLLRNAFDVAHDVAAVAVAESYRRYPRAVVEAHPWMREMPPYCLRRIIARRAWAEALR